MAAHYLEFSSEMNNSGVSQAGIFIKMNWEMKEKRLSC